MEYKMRTFVGSKNRHLRETKNRLLFLVDKQEINVFRGILYMAELRTFFLCLFYYIYHAQNCMQDRLKILEV